MKSTSWLIFAPTLLIAVCSGYLIKSVSAAGAPTQGALVYSAQLTDLNGTPVSGTKNVQVALYQKQTPAAEERPECIANMAGLSLIAGRFQVGLPETCADATRKLTDLWIEARSMAPLCHAPSWVPSLTLLKQHVQWRQRMPPRRRAFHAPQVICWTLELASA